MQFFHLCVSIKFSEYVERSVGYIKISFFIYCFKIKGTLYASVLFTKVAC